MKIASTKWWYFLISELHNFGGKELILINIKKILLYFDTITFGKTNSNF